MEEVEVREGEPVVHIEFQMVHGMVLRIVYTWNSKWNSRVVHVAEHPHDDHIHSESMDVDGE